MLQSASSQLDPAAQQQLNAAAAGVGIVGGLLYIVILVLVMAGMWKIFVKAGKPGWAAIVPIYNIVVLCEIVGRPAWWIVLCLIPCVNIVIIALLCIDLAKSFGKSAGYGIGILLVGFILVPMLGFGSDQYKGPAAKAA
jgi:hypothetical protein